MIDGRALLRSECDKEYPRHLNFSFPPPFSARVSQTKVLIFQNCFHRIASQKGAVAARSSGGYNRQIALVVRKPEA
jgi:hypothetical protein